MSRASSYLRGIAAAALGAASIAAHAGGPLASCYGTPVKYPGAGTVTLRYDGGGSFGPRTKPATDALVTSAISMWTNVSTSTLTLSRGTDLPADVTAANYTSYYGRYSDGINPVIYDTDGSIIDSIIGVGASSSVLGFAGSAWSDNGAACSYVEGQAVINAAISVSDATLTNVMAHEVGHLIGMDHTQLDSTQGLGASNYPLMYPIAYRTLVSLHADDAAAVTALYPDASRTTVYGEITGTFTQANGTAIRGANIFAQGAAGVFSVVSDYLEQNTGYFRLLLPAGTYTLRAEAIDRSFTGGSSVGPYTESSSGLSFQPPLYSGTTPMATVALGGATPTQISISAGCAATATFRLDGSGSVGGNCGAPPVPVPVTPTTIAPSGAVASLTPAYSWNASATATSYNLTILGASGTIATHTYAASAVGCVSGTGTCSVIPTTTLANGTAYSWQVSAANASGTSPLSGARSFNIVIGTPPAQVVTVAPNGTIAAMSPTYTWNAVSNAISYDLLVQNIFGVFVNANYTAAAAGCASGTGTCSVTPSVVLTNGHAYNWFVAARNALGTSAWSAARTITIAAGSPPAVPTQLAPTGTITATMNPTYTWNASTGATGYWLTLRNSGGVYTDRAVTADAAGCPTGTGVCSFRPGAPVPNNTSWTWTVAATNLYGMSAFSAGLPITVAVPSLVPAVPTQVGPTGTITASMNPTYTWNASAGATGYWLTLRNSGGVYTDRAVTADAAGCPTGTGTCSFRPGAPVPNNTSWTWTVAATNANGMSAFSAGLPITIAVPSSIPVTPAQVGPTGTLTATVNPTYVWTASAGATSYWLTLRNAGGVWTDRSVTAAEAGCEAGTGNCSFTPGAGLPNNTSWTWVVYAANANGASPFSPGLPIATNVPHVAPGAPTLISPVGTIATTTPTYTWNASPGASSYNLFVQNLYGVAVNLYVTSKQAGCPSGAGACSYTPTTALGNNLSWNWFVGAINEYGTSPWSQGNTITVIAP